MLWGYLSKLMELILALNAILTGGEHRVKDSGGSHAMSE